jgi:hypothetical protein
MKSQRSASSNARWRIVGFLVLAGAMLGCRGDPRFLPTYPARGQVFFEGKPAAGVLVFFHGPIGKGNDWTKPSASTDTEGNFSLVTYRQGDGAPVGNYTVTVATGTESKVTGLPTHYADPATSGLTAEVKPVDNVLPRFDLTR